MFKKYWTLVCRVVTGSDQPTESGNRIHRPLSQYQLCALYVLSVWLSRPVSRIWINSRTVPSAYFTNLHCQVSRMINLLCQTRQILSLEYLTFTNLTLSPREQENEAEMQRRVERRFFKKAAFQRKFPKISLRFLFLALIRWKFSAAVLLLFRPDPFNLPNSYFSFFLQKVFFSLILQNFWSERERLIIVI